MTDIQNDSYRDYLMPIILFITKNVDVSNFFYK